MEEIHRKSLRERRPRCKHQFPRLLAMYEPRTWVRYSLRRQGNDILPSGSICGRVGHEADLAKVSSTAVSRFCGKRSQNLNDFQLLCNATIMPSIDLDSSSDEGGDYTTTNVTLGYASQDATSDDISHLGGHSVRLLQS